MLTPEEMRAIGFQKQTQGDTKRETEAPLEIGKKQPEDKKIVVLESLTKAASAWRNLKRNLSHAEGSETLRRLTERVPLLAASLRNYLYQGISDLGQKKTRVLRF